MRQYMLSIPDEILDAARVDGASEPRIFVRIVLPVCKPALISLGISVRGRSRRLSLNYRTTQEILAWAVPLLGTNPVTGLDGEVDSLIGYRSPMHGPRPQHKLTVSRAEELTFLTERIGSWLSDGIEPHAPRPFGPEPCTTSTYPAPASRASSCRPACAVRAEWRIDKPWGDALFTTE